LNLCNVLFAWVFFDSEACVIFVQLSRSEWIFKLGEF